MHLLVWIKQSVKLICIFNLLHALVTHFDRHTKALFDEYKGRVHGALANKTMQPSFPEKLVAHRLSNTWHDSGEALMGNWMGLVYQVTHKNRELQYMEGVNPEDPLGWLAAGVATGWVFGSC